MFVVFVVVVAVEEEEEEFEIVKTPSSKASRNVV